MFSFLFFCSEFQEKQGDLRLSRCDLCSLGYDSLNSSVPLNLFLPHLEIWSPWEYFLWIFRVFQIYLLFAHVTPRFIFPVEKYCLAEKPLYFSLSYCKTSSHFLSIHCPQIFFSVLYWSRFQAVESCLVEVSLLCLCLGKTSFDLKTDFSQQDGLCWKNGIHLIQNIFTVVPT